MKREGNDFPTSNDLAVAKRMLDEMEKVPFVRCRETLDIDDAATGLLALVHCELRRGHVGMHEWRLLGGSACIGWKNAGERGCQG